MSFCLHPHPIVAGICVIEADIWQNSWKQTIFVKTSHKTGNYDMTPECQRLVTVLKHFDETEPMGTWNFQNQISSFPILNMFRLFTHPRRSVQIATKIQSVLHCTTLDPSIKFHYNPFITFWVMLLTNRQTDRQLNQHYQKHNLLGKLYCRKSHLFGWCWNISTHSNLSSYCWQSNGRDTMMRIMRTYDI